MEQPITDHSKAPRIGFQARKVVAQSVRGLLQAEFRRFQVFAQGFE